jgi:serine/threonine-protein kinase
MESSLAPGLILGRRYRIVRLIGSGGMGSVYEALQTDLGRRVALKVLDPRLTFEAAHIERFRREAHAAAMLGHPNIVQVTDFQTNQGEPPFLVMDFLEGQSLAQVLDRHGRIDAMHAARIGVQVLDALAAAHRAGIVHRDIKPDNVFLMQVPAVGEIVKVLDFGVAKLADAPPSSAQLTATGAMLGTPAYMAPEQARGANVDARADLYAVGASLYHALAGTMPFIANSAPALLFAIVEQQPAPLAQLRPDLPRELVMVIERAMAKDANARFQSADEMRAALAPIAQVSLPPSVVVSSSGQQGAPSAYAATIGSNPPGMMPASAPQPIAPGVMVPSGVPVVMGQPTFGGVAQATPQPPLPRPKQAAAVVRNVFLGIAAVLLILGGIAVAILWILKPKTEATQATPTSPSASVASSSAPIVSSSAGVIVPPATSTATSTGTTPATTVATVHKPPAPVFTTTATQNAAPARFGKYLTGVEIELNPVLAPAPAGAPHPYSGKRFNQGGSSGLDLGPDKSCGGDTCDGSGFRKSIPDASVSACYAASQFEPPTHENNGYYYSWDSTGTITHVWREPWSPSIPRIDACLARLILAAKMPLTKPVPGFGEISFGAECDIGWHDHCDAFTAADGVVRPIGK